ncbi:integrase, catalytic region, zinc finger, CCHC-type containing protein [Tanacetum coccineum]
MSTLAEFMIVVGADNRPLMLDKPMYESWKSRMELYIQGKDHGWIILNSVENVHSFGLRRTQNWHCWSVNFMKELSDKEKLQADCNLKATNIVLQGTSLSKKERECKLYDEFDKFSHVKGETFLPPEWGKFVTVVKLARDLHTSSFNPRNQATVQQVQGRQGQNVVSLGSQGNALGSRGNTLGHVKVVKCYNFQGEGHMARQCTQPKRRRDATWFKEKVLLIQAHDEGKELDEEKLSFLTDPKVVDGQVSHTITHNEAFKTNDLDVYDSDCDDIYSTKAVLMANLLSCDSNVLSKAQYSNTFQNDMMNQSVQELQFSE